jgi:hypothetical protein
MPRSQSPRYPLSRRGFFTSAAAAIAVPAQSVAPPQAVSGGSKLRVQFTPGGHTSPLEMYAMFEDDLFRDCDTTVFPHPNAFHGLSDRSGPDVVVTNDWITGGWPEADRQHMVKYLDSGKGLVVLHHAVGTNNNEWPWFSEEATGVMLWNPDVPGMKTQSRLKQFVRQTLSPVGNHPITKGIEPFTLPWDETFPNMWLSPKITPVIQSDDPDYVQPAVGWVGVHPKARVVCFSPGHTRFACADPMYRKVVHNMILWAGGKLS